jgi:GTP-binding protein
MAARRPLIAIVGRPNVGKSRLFNRLTRSRLAIVEDVPGVTRDRHYGDGEWYGRAFATVDTGGFDPDSEDVLLQQMREQAQIALEEADLIFFMMDGREGLTPTDQEIARLMRTTNKPLFPIVNKVDGPRHEDPSADFYALGFEQLYLLSAEHGYRFDELMDEVALLLPELEEVENRDADEGGPLKLAVVGRPNAGKSTLINRLLGYDRLLTSEIPGTTRDAIDTLHVHDGQEYLFIDTAGIRRRRSIDALMEKFSVVQAFKAIDRADVILFMIEAREGLAEQDKRLIRLILDKGRPHVLLINKWDAIEKDNETTGRWYKALQEELDFASYAPTLFISALTGQRVHKIYEQVQEVHAQWTRRIQTSHLNQWLLELTRKHSPPIFRRRPLKLYFASQVTARPPTFMITVNHPEGVAPAYKRFLLNRLREDFDFKGTPLKMFFRARKQRNEDDADFGG